MVILRVLVVVVIVLLIRGNVICWKTIERQKNIILKLREENIDLRIQCKRLEMEKQEVLKDGKNGEL